MPTNRFADIECLKTDHIYAINELTDVTVSGKIVLILSFLFIQTRCSETHSNWHSKRWTVFWTDSFSNILSYVEPIAQFEPNINFEKSHCDPSGPRSWVCGLPFVSGWQALNTNLDIITVLWYLGRNWWKIWLPGNLTF